MQLLRISSYLLATIAIRAMAQTNATNSTSVVHTVLQRTSLPQLPGWESRLVHVEYPPGIKSALHNHPVPGLGYVLEGQAISAWEDGNIEIYSAGQSFTDLAKSLHVQAGNANPTETLKFLVNYVIPIDEDNIKYFS